MLFDFANTCDVDAGIFLKEPAFRIDRLISSHESLSYRDIAAYLPYMELTTADYRDTAAKFQKEWHIKAPHRDFEFAPYVKTQALVNVVNKGLNYLALERKQRGPERLILPADAEEQIRARGIFGPLVTEPPPFERVGYRADSVEETKPVNADASVDAAAPTPTINTSISFSAPAITSASSTAPALSTATALQPVLPPIDDVDSARKRQISLKQQTQQPESPVKKQRLSNGHDSAPTEADAAQAAPPTPMEIDGSENQHAYPSPMERELVPTPIIRTDGPEQGTQIDKVEELTPETTFLRLASDRVVDTNSRVESRQHGRQNPIVLHCEWNPKKPSVLAAAGTDALARIWTISRTALNPEPVTNHVNGVSKPYRDLAAEEGMSQVTVTAMSWNPEGTTIAIATEVCNRARVSIWSPDGVLLHQYNVREPPVIKLRWNPSGTSIIGIAPEGTGTLVTVFSAEVSNMAPYLLQDHDLGVDPLDVAWTTESEFLLCGGDLLAAFRVTDSGVVAAKTLNTRKDEHYTMIQYDSESRIAATASERGVIDLWDEFGERRSITAHIGLITSLAWQPLQGRGVENERLLASGGEDGAISIWNARIPDGKPKCSMTMDLPVTALAFTPDGAFIAGATPEKILIWKVGDHAIPRASWQKTPHPGWSSPRLNIESDDEDTHCLCWDVTGQKLAYGVNSRLAVINFR
ncbi:hypothetical protein SEPCBS119000_004912 [Sporothrix epigloea]|uniref:WD repeat protein n=1 Tax=Sporothrix epigloea TaxID=1892477 RepID=A0ABP0DXK9_9PEZI